MNILSNLIISVCLAGQLLCAAVANQPVLAVPAPAPVAPVLPVPAVVAPGHSVVQLTLSPKLTYANNLNEFTLPALANGWGQMAPQLNAALKSNRDYKCLINNGRLALSGSVLAASLMLATHMCCAALDATSVQPQGMTMAVASGLFAGTSAAHFLSALYKWFQGVGPVYHVVCNPLQSKKKYGVLQPCLSVKMSGGIKDAEDKKVLYGLLQSIPHNVNNDIASALSWKAWCSGLSTLTSGSLFAGGLASLGYLGATTSPLTELSPQAAAFGAIALGTLCAATWCARSMVKFATGPRIFGNPPTLATAVPVTEVGAAAA